MSATISNIAITITANNLATAKINQLNQTIANLQKPVVSAGKAMSKFSDGTGLVRSAENMRTFGDQTLGAARALERVVAPMELLTAAASIAGLAALAKSWADTGSSIVKTAYILDIPVKTLSRFQIAAKLSNTSSEAMTDGLVTMSNTMRQIAYGQGATQTPIFKQLGIDSGTPGHVRSVTEGMGQLASYLETLKEPGAKANALDLAGLSRDLMPLLGRGRKHFDEMMKGADQTGGEWTEGMGENAQKLQSSYANLEATLGGIENRIVDDWSATAKQMMDVSSNWIQNNPDIAAHYTKIATGIVAAAGILVAAATGNKLMRVALRALGLGFLATAGDVYLAQEMLYEGTRVSDTQGQDADTPHYPGWAEGRESPPTAGEQRARSNEGIDYFTGQGRTPEQAAAIMGSLRQESGFNPRSGAGTPHQGRPIFRSRSCR
jgi:hypothetical protein